MPSVSYCLQNLSQVRQQQENEEKWISKIRNTSVVLSKPGCVCVCFVCVYSFVHAKHGSSQFNTRPHYSYSYPHAHSLERPYIQICMQFIHAYKNTYKQTLTHRKNIHLHECTGQIWMEDTAYIFSSKNFSTMSTSSVPVAYFWCVCVPFAFMSESGHSDILGHKCQSRTSVLFWGRREHTGLANTTPTINLALSYRYSTHWQSVCFSDTAMSLSTHFTMTD